jgi:hypothetical protein
MNASIVCPHCRNDVPRGATVCRGRHAEVEYAPSRGLLLLGTLTAPSFGIFVGDRISTSDLNFFGKIEHGIPVISGFLACTVAFIAIGVLLQMIFEKRVVFTRAYRRR